MFMIHSLKGNKMNKELQKALGIIRTEYLRCSNSTDRYKMREEVVEFMNSIRVEKTEQVRMNSGDEKLSKLLAVISENSGVKLEFVQKLELDCTIPNMLSKLGMDNLDWIEMIMHLEDNFDVEFSLDFEDHHLMKKLTLSDIFDVVSSK